MGIADDISKDVYQGKKKRGTKDRVLKVVTFSLSEKNLEEIDELVNEGFFPSRSEAIRTAIRDLMMQEKGK